MRLAACNRFNALVLIFSLFVVMSSFAQQVSVDSYGKVRSRSGGFVFPDGSTQVTALIGATYTTGPGLTSTGTTLAISPSGVQTSMLAPGAVTTEKLANGAVTSLNIADGAVSSAKLAPPTGYLFAYSLAGPDIFREWQTVGFSVIAQTDGWALAGEGFTCASSGLYLIQYSAEAGAAATQTASFRATVNGIEVSGSQSSAIVSVSGVSSISKSFVASVSAGGVLTFQVAGGSNFPLRLVPNSGSGDVRPSFSITVVKLK